MDKEIAEQPTALADTLLRPLRRHRDRAGRAAAGRGRPAHHRQGVRGRLRHRLPLRPGRQVRDRALDPAAGRGRAGQRVPLPRPGARPGHAGRRGQPVRRDRRHPGGGPARPTAAGPGARGLQHQRLADPPRVRRGAVHARRPRGRGGVHQGVPGPGDRELPGRAGPGAGPRHQVPRRGRPGIRGAVRDAGGGRADADADGSGPRSSAGRSPTRRRCCSSAGTSATRSRSRVRSSSRNWPTCTPRASRPASSSTARSR